MDKSLIYKSIHIELDNFLKKYNETHNLSLISKLISLVSIIKINFKNLNFVGFYLVVKKDDYKGNYKLNSNNEILEVGPYISDIIATPIIEFGKGVCGETWERRETMIINNVLECKNYIACDDVTKSEIVIPLMNKNNECIGVLDIDSTEFDSFSNEDKVNYESLLSKLN